MTDQEYMRIALQLAEGTSGQTSPNPMVGAVVVKDGNIVGMGLIYELVKNTQKFMPFKWLVRTPKDATVYVTLEPCSHFGKTPPCCELLIEKELSVL